MWWVAVLVIAHGGTAEAAPKSAAPPVGAAGAGAAATAPSSSAPASPSPSSGPAPEGSVAPPAPDATAPAPDTTTPPPTAPAAEDSNGAAEEEEEQEEEPPRKKRAKRHPARVIAAEDTDQEPESAEATETARPPIQSWRLVGPHFLLGIERITNVLGWSVTESVEVTSSNNNFGGTPTTLELKRGGTDVSFLGSGAVSPNVFGVPRLALDAMLDNGFTLGGSLSYMAVSLEHEQPVSGSVNKASVDDGSSSVFIFAPRIGVMIPASPFVGIWLRGGVSRIAVSSEANLVTSVSGEQITSTVTSTLTLVDLTLDPQLVINPVPHVGITLGALLDIGISGTQETSGAAASHDVTASSYGITGGLVAIF
jgi:hypothetical protein